MAQITSAAVAIDGGRELIDLLNNQDNKQGFIKALMRAYINGGLKFPYNEII